MLQPFKEHGCLKKAQIILDLGSKWQLMLSAECLRAATKFTARVPEQRDCLCYRCSNKTIDGKVWCVCGSLQQGLGWRVSLTNWKLPVTCCVAQVPTVLSSYQVVCWTGMTFPTTWTAPWPASKCFGPLDSGTLLTQHYSSDSTAAA
jgi:hypothetical protein